MKTYRSRLLPRWLFVIVLAVPATAAAQRMDPVYVEDRLNQLQQAITLLTGQIEQLQYRNQQLQQQMEKMQADYEFRLEQMEKGGRPGGAAPRPAAPGGNLAATPPAPGAPPPSAAGTANGDQQYHDAFKRLQDGDYAGAEKGFRTFLQGNPKHVLAGNAQYWLGETYYVRNDFKNAAVAFAEGYQKYPDSQKAPDNLLKLAMALGQQGQKENACVALRQLEKRYPDASANIKDRAVRAKKNYSCT
jgi:tol-pal system protein YbgF